MDAEMENHRTNGSWEWIKRSDVPTDRRVIKLIWVYKIKRSGKLKSRLCVQGCNQVAGVDYDQTFSAALRSPSLRLLASYAVSKGYSLRRWISSPPTSRGPLRKARSSTAMHRLATSALGTCARS